MDGSGTIVVPTAINLTSGEVLHLGREARVANRAQRRALRAMYPTCAFAGCTASFSHCQIHHIHPWHQGGPTNLNNLLPLCSRHHHLVHEGRWRIHLDPDRELHIHQPDGTHYRTVALPSADLAGALHAQSRRRARPPDRPSHNRAA